MSKLAEYRALYTTSADPSNQTPALIEGETLTLIKSHDSGWLEIAKSDGTRGYVSPAWVEEIISKPSPPTQQDAPVR